MTIKEATIEMLKMIEIEHRKMRGINGQKGTDKEVANMIGISQAAYSRLRTGVNEPKIMTWYKIYRICVEKCGMWTADSIIKLIQ